MAKIRKVLQMTSRRGCTYKVFYESGRNYVYSIQANLPLTVLKWLLDAEVVRTVWLESLDGEIKKYETYMTEEA